MINLDGGTDEVSGCGATWKFTAGLVGRYLKTTRSRLTIKTNARLRLK